MPRFEFSLPHFSSLQRFVKFPIMFYLNEEDYQSHGLRNLLSAVIDKIFKTHKTQLAQLSDLGEFSREKLFIDTMLTSRLHMLEESLTSFLEDYEFDVSLYHVPQHSLYKDDAGVLSWGRLEDKIVSPRMISILGTDWVNFIRNVGLTQDAELRSQALDFLRNSERVTKALQNWKDEMWQPHGVMARKGWEESQLLIKMKH
ncbi:hypothetical protein DFS34DRAFT_616825 [Phlyctochytrium arcticum]|nr:hypothetical protein DFS34DRAFT_616825 [Phlyctochytrium arcticum]